MDKTSSPIPWYISEDKRKIMSKHPSPTAAQDTIVANLTALDLANAELIVAAVNSYRPPTPLNQVLWERWADEHLTNGVGYCAKDTWVQCRASFMSHFEFGVGHAEDAAMETYKSIYGDK